MEDIEVLRTMVKSFRLIELRNLMLFAGLSKLGRKIELLARALELIQNADEKIVAKIRELSGEMYKGPAGLTGVSETSDKESQNKSGSVGVTAAQAPAAAAGNGTTELSGSATSTENNTEEDETVPLSASLATKKSKKSKDRDKSKKSKKKKKDKKKHKSSSKKRQLEAETRYDPKPKGGKSKGLTVSAPAMPPPPPAAGRSRRAAAIAATSALQSWAGGGQTGDDSGDNVSDDDMDSDGSSSEDESSGAATESDSEVDGEVELQESTRPKKRGGKNQHGKSQATVVNSTASAATSSGLLALSAMVPQATGGAMLPLPPPGERLDPTRLAAAYSHLMGRGSFLPPPGGATAATAGTATANSASSGASAAAKPAIPATRPNYCGFTYRTVPQIPESPAASTSSNYIPPAERPAHGAAGATTTGQSTYINSYTNKSHLIYPTCPDVRLKRLPFYDVMATLLKPQSLQPNGSARFQEQTFSFHLTPQQVSAIEQSGYRDSMGRPDYKKQIQVRFSLLETSCEQADNFPSSVCVKVNGRLQPLPNPIPTNKPGVEPKRPPKAINVTGLCKLSSTCANYINVSWTVEVGKAFTLSVYHVERLNSTELLQKLKVKGQRHSDYTRAVIKDKLNDTDSEIATTSCKVSLACPLGKMRMRYPCRSSQCDHLQCFDAANYVMMNEKKDKWMCPVCNNVAPFDTLMLDGYFTEMLQSKRLPDDEHEIVLHADASWEPLPPKIPDHLNPKNFDQAPGAPVPASSQVSKPKETEEHTVETLSDDESPPPASTAAAAPSKSNGKKANDGGNPVECVTLDSEDEEGTAAAVAASTSTAAAVAAAAAAVSTSAKRQNSTDHEGGDSDEVRPPSKRRKASRVVFDDDSGEDDDVSDGSGGVETTGNGTSRSATGAPGAVTDVNAAHEALVALAAAAARQERVENKTETIEDMRQDLEEIQRSLAARAAAAAAEPELVCLDDDDED